jgi:hypothetical protein
LSSILSEVELKWFLLVTGTVPSFTTGRFLISEKLNCRVIQKKLQKEDTVIYWYLAILYLSFLLSRVLFLPYFTVLYLVHTRIFQLFSNQASTVSGIYHCTHIAVLLCRVLFAIFYRAVSRPHKNFPAVPLTRPLSGILRFVLFGSLNVTSHYLIALIGILPCGHKHDILL